MAFVDKLIGSLERVQERNAIREAAREERHQQTMAYLAGEITAKEMRENKREIRKQKNEDIVSSEVEGFVRNFFER